ncbi:MAG: ribosome maturation factor RimP [Lachnospiraceae bacterium]|nr:ribosome maturation factor RimP [Lachnospiraceae bacterium]
MAKREEIERQAENLILPVLEEHRFELWDTEYVKEAGTWYLRYYIDKEGGITIDDCETVSRRVSDLLDEKDFIPEAYILEVSSPGLGRQLKKPRDFERSLGEEVEIRLFRAVEGSKEYTGVLRGYDEKTFTIEFEDGETMVIARPDVAVIRLAFDF